MQKITPMLWFDDKAEEAVTLYTSLFKNSRVTQVARYGDAGPGPKGSVMTMAFELDGQAFTALNGGPLFKFTEAISLVVNCDDQAEVDAVWDKLTADGGQPSRCGWLKDKFGLSWQVVPKAFVAMIADPDPIKVGRVMQAMMTMAKLDLATLKTAFDGG